MSDTELTTDAWPDDEFATRAPEIASDVARLLADEPRWIHRRVETFTFNDDSSVRRQTSVDFTIPSFIDPKRHHRDGGLVFLPLSLIEKRVLVNFDLRDETDTSVSMVPRSQNARVATQVLIQQAEEALRARGRSAELLDANVESLRVLSGEREPHDVSGAEEADAVAQAQEIISDEVARGFIQELSGSFVLLAALAAKPGDRRIVKFAYDADFVPLRVTGIDGEATSRVFLSWLRARGEALLEVVGLRSFRTGFPLTAITDGQSYHVELVFPDELIADAEMVEYDDDEMIASRDHRRGAGRLHLYGGDGSADVDWAALVVQFGLRAGVVAPVFLLSAVTTATLVVGLVAHSWWHIPTAGDAAGALVVALPTFFAPVVAPGGHRLVRRMFKGLRGFVFLTALVSFVAAATLVLGIPDTSRVDTTDVWTVLAVISGLISLTVAVVLVRAPRGP